MFDEQPDGDPHGECASEIHRLQAENEKFRAAFADLLSVRDQFAKAVLPQFLELEVTGVWNQSLPDAVSKRDHAQQVANAAYYMADAMMAARTRGVSATDSWKEAVLDKLAITCGDAPIGTPPADILDQIIRWHVAVATDPAVSEEMAKQHDAVDTLTEKGWTWDGDQWQRPAGVTPSHGGQP
jgi:hypothetical protein